ncbi:MAG TPA: NADH-ubiquinone oxidoreductase-F iron-sulfur binding region domain-containing protein [Planctomycetota bacterium]
MNLHFLLPKKPIASYAEYLKTFKGRPPISIAKEMAPDEIVGELLASGLRGRGGAGFPTGRKWAAVRGHACRARTVLCNAAEGEPATFKDRFLLRMNPYAPIEGMIAAARVVETDRLFIAAKKSFRKELGRLRNALEEMRGAGALDGLSIQIVEGPEEYLFGEEKALLEVVEGKGPLPREAHYPPYQWGLNATLQSPNPALVNNVETFARVPGILRHGAASFRKLGTPDTPGPVIFTVCGDVRRPGVYEREAGIRLRDLFETVAGGPRRGRSFKAALPGVSAAVLPEDRFGTPAEFGALAGIGSGLGAAGFWVLDDSTSMARVALAVARFLFVESCNQCTACKAGLREAWESLDALFRGDGPLDRRIEEMVYGAKSAPQGNRCYLPVQGSKLLPSLVERFRGEFERLEGAPVAIPKIADADERGGAFTYDPMQERKLPDWTYAEKKA